jgi:hypothetical protein
MRRERGATPHNHAPSSRKAQAAAGLLVVGLQQRLLSSTEAFARSLRVHRRTVEWQWAAASVAAPNSGVGEELASSRGGAETSSAPASEPQLTAPDTDDERAEWTPEQLEADENAQIAGVNDAAESGAAHDTAAQAQWRREQQLLDRMQEIAEATRHPPDAKTRRLLDWVRTNLCPGSRPTPTSTAVSPSKSWRAAWTRLQSCA